MAMEEEQQTGAPGGVRELKQGDFMAPNPFFVPVMMDPASGMPIIPLYRAQPASDRAPEAGGLFAVSMFPNVELVPLSYGAPLAGGDGEDAATEAETAAARARAEQRHVVRRFRVGIHIDLLLIVKLVTMVFIFSQDGSRDKLLLLLLAGVVYLYQTGSLQPFLRWAAQWARRAMMPPVQAPTPEPEVRAADPQDATDAVPPAPEGARLDQEGAAAGEQQQNTDDQQPLQEPQVQQREVVAHGGNWRGFLREVQVFVLGLLTSLLPGFHNVD